MSDRQRLLLPVKELPGRLQTPRPPPSLHQALHPRTNGKAECFIQTALREWAYTNPLSG